MKKLLFIMFLTGCISQSALADNIDIEDEDEDNYTSISDPLENINRKIFSFNETLDKYTLKPIAIGYRTVTPKVVQTGTSNFFNNLKDVSNVANNLLQGNFKKSLDSFGRVIFNSTFGLAGLIDISSDFGIERHDTNFGTTLGKWGVGEGAYIVLPLLGPSNVRDGVGRIVDTQMDLVWKYYPIKDRNILIGYRAISDRAEILDAENIFNEMSLDKYNQLRDAYHQKREFDIKESKSDN